MKKNFELFLSKEKKKIKLIQKFYISISLIDLGKLSKNEEFSKNIILSSPSEQGQLLHWS